MPKPRSSLRIGLLLGTVLAAPTIALAAAPEAIGSPATLLPTGLSITPTVLAGAVQQLLNPGLAAYPNFVAGEAVQARLSPDGTLLAIICAGQNSLDNASGNTDAANSTQYIFLYNVGGNNKTKPVLAQVIKQANAHVGLVWAPDGKTLYAAGGNDDAVYAYTNPTGAFALAAKIALNHNKQGVGLAVQPNASGLGISADGKTLVVANNYNDSVSVIDTATSTVRYEHDLRPYLASNEGTSGVAGGEYPFAVLLKGNGTAYVSSTRDRQVVVLDVSSPTDAKLVGRIALDGNPYGMALSADQATLYVAEDNSDQVAVIKTQTNAVEQKIDVRAPAGILPGYKQTGAAPFAVTLSPNGKQLYVVNNGANEIAVVSLAGAKPAVIGLIPTAYAPKDVAFSQDGTWLYIINGKSNTGPNPTNLSGSTAEITSITYPGGNAAAAAAAAAGNQYQFQLEHASLVSARVPTAQQLGPLTAQVADNNGYSTFQSQSDAQVMAFVRKHIKHVIYIVKENRTFDQILGDLPNGANADPTLVQFGRALTPNFHNIATNFVTLDNFMDPADGSMDGWSWSMRGRITNDEELTQQINYAFVNRGLSYESEGSNRNVPVGLAAQADRDAATGGKYSALSAALPGGTANLLPGTADVSTTDFETEHQTGYIMDAALRAGLSLRNYGFMVNNIAGATTDASGKPVTNPGAAGVAQAVELNPALVPVTDVYFRGFDQTYSDQWDVNEWYREFQQYVTYGDLPAFETVRLSHDHTGSFAKALAGVNTPDTQEADNDLAVGRMVDYVAHSRFAKDTLFIVTEDDSQDGPDHVDSHRSTAYIVGPYVKKNTVVSTRYSQVNALRTIEDILGLKHLNLNTAFQAPMADVFDVTSKGAWTYTATASTILQTTQLALADTGVRYAEGPRVHPRQDAAYWAKQTAGFDFSGEDRVPTGLFNKVLWEGTRPGVPYPAKPSTN